MERKYGTEPGKGKWKERMEWNLERENGTKPGKEEQNEIIKRNLESENGKKEWNGIEKGRQKVRVEKKKQEWTERI